MRAKFTLAVDALTISLAGLHAQTGNQQVIQPTSSVATTAVAAPVAPTGLVDGDANAKALLQTLLQLKAANDEILKRQTATLSQLEEVSKAAEQLKVYATRG
ncbi:MAG: hypothetical protein ABR526_00225 [Chthoniobacterales bacterium]